MLVLEGGDHEVNARRIGKEVSRMLQSLKSRLLALGTAAALVGGTLGGIGLVHAQTPQPSNTAPAVTQQQLPDEPEQEAAAETSGSDKVEANENLPGGGHADQPGVDVQHEFQGIE
jgi:hypothetical protein